MNLSMIQMFRRVLAALSVALLLAGCGGGGNNPGTPLNKLNATMQLNSVNGSNTAYVNPQTTTVLVAYLKDGSGHPMAGQMIEFQVASSTGASGSLVSGMTYTDANKTVWPASITDANGVARITYVAPTVPASDTINAIAVNAAGSPVASLQVQTGQPAAAGTSYVVTFTAVTGTDGKPTAVVGLNGTASVTAHAVAVGANGVSYPAAGKTLQFLLGSTSSGTASTINSTSTGNTTSGTSSGTSSNVTQTPPTINGAYASYLATTDTNGNATISYKAGSLTGVDTIIANLMSNATATASVLASGSVAIAVSDYVTSPWAMALSGTPVPTGSTATCTTAASTSNQQGNTVSCTGVPENAITSSGLQTAGNGVRLAATVTDSNGHPMAGAAVIFAIGSSSTGTQQSYCTPPKVLTSGNCQDNTTTPATLSAPSQASVNAGFRTSTGTISPSITILTDANGVATAQYLSGGSTGTDVVIVTAGTNTGTVTTPAQSTINVTQSATMSVN